jgi:hypothetical protein
MCSVERKKTRTLVRKTHLSIYPHLERKCWEEGEREKEIDRGKGRLLKRTSSRKKNEKSVNLLASVAM